MPTDKSSTNFYSSIKNKLEKKILFLLRRNSVNQIFMNDLITQGKLFTGKEGLAFSFSKCIAGGVVMLLEDK